MTPQGRDDELLEDYLRGESRISRLYRRDADEQPGTQLDARILSRARHAVTRKPRAVHGPFARHWTVPVSLAAVLVVAVSVVVLLPEPAIEPGKPAAVGGDADDRLRKEAEEKASVPPEPMPAAPAEPVLRRDRSSVEGDAGGGRALDNLPEPTALPRRHAAEPLGESGAERVGAETRDEAVPPPASIAAPAPLQGTVSRAQALPPPEVQDEPRAWLSHIEALLEGGFETQARDSLRAFRARYPDHPLPERLRPLARALDRERP